MVCQRILDFIYFHRSSQFLCYFHAATLQYFSFFKIYISWLRRWLPPLSPIMLGWYHDDIMMLGWYPILPSIGVVYAVVILAHHCLPLVQNKVYPHCQSGGMFICYLAFLSRSMNQLSLSCALYFFILCSCCLFKPTDALWSSHTRFWSFDPSKPDDWFT